MKVLAVVHQEDAGPGVFADAVAAAGHTLVEWNPPAGEDPPAHDALFVLGGAMNVDDEQRLPWLRDEKALLREAIQREVPALGVCLGAQLLAEAAGGSAQRAERPEIGWVEVEVERSDDPVVGPLAPRFEAFEWHSYEFSPPSGAVVLARSDVGVQAARLHERAWAIQFHAEVDPPTTEHWIAHHEEDEDAVRIGVDPAALRAESQPRLAAWNELGRALCARFLAAAATPA